MVQSACGKRPLWNMFHDRMVSMMTDADIDLYKEKLVDFVDQMSEESSELFIDRPRFVHAVVVVADETSPGELLKLSTIRRVDPVYEPVPPADCDAPRVLHEYTQNDYKSVNEYHDNDIEMALRRLQESHDMLNSQNKEMMEKTPTTPEKQKPISVLEQETPRLKSTLFNQFPSMNRKGLQIN
ncbi:hypothetical protein L596_012383 [Steinernema carpocapsae]|uniref:Uncharacterized protein n=1 Tax=Steinernema carpocapsae TaxID=34508 RepID=A0A4U5NXI7_STECR|nr:hypothetical protein L596_012383 [Steinernema carpocapsae]